MITREERLTARRPASPAAAPGALRARPSAHRRSPLRLATLIVVNLVGLLAFLWPFVLPVTPGVNENHANDGPVILAVLVICLGAVLFVELGRGGLGPKTIALLGVLGAAMVALRLPGFVAGFSAMFIVVLVAGNAFGPGFGFLLGAVGTFASGLFLGGLGPWLPFQMVAVGWVGMGAGLLPKTTWPVRIGSLAAYGAVAGVLFGAIMNLWSWPFLTTGTAVDWDSGRRGHEPAPLPDVLRLELVRLGHVPRGGQRRARAPAGPPTARRARPGREEDAPRGVPVASWAMTQALSDRTHIHRHPERGDHDRATIPRCSTRPCCARSPGSTRRGAEGTDDPGAHRRHAPSARTARRPGMEGGRRRRRSASWPRWSTSSCSPARPRRTSMNYRSVVLFGRGREVTERNELYAAARAITAHVLPGRELDAAEPDDDDWRETLILAMPIDEASAKVRTGPPKDDDEDLAFDVWAGTLPLRTVVGPPTPSPDLRASIDVPTYIPSSGEELPRP